ncbi:MAG: carbon storage regulator [Bryobacteraceae bacterium]
MLVIRRRAGEALVIGDDIEIEILETGSAHVKLGIRAPKSVPVARREIYVAGRQNQAASRPISPAAVEELLDHFKKAQLKNPSLKPISAL